MKRKQVVCTNVNRVSGISEILSIVRYCYFFLLTKFLLLACKGADRMNNSPRHTVGELSHFSASKS